MRLEYMRVDLEKDRSFNLTVQLTGGGAQISLVKGLEAEHVANYFEALAHELRRVARDAGVVTTNQQERVQ